VWKSWNIRLNIITVQGVTKVRPDVRGMTKGTEMALRSVRSHLKIEIFEFVKIPPISKSHKLLYGFSVISLTLGIHDL
jgi:hypothetical protein